MARPEFSPPAQFDDYCLLRTLGEGSTGVVALCLDTKLRRRVAVKFFKAARFDPHRKDGFWREVHAIARLTHPNIVSVHSVGEFAGIPYLVTEFVEGRSLASLETPVSDVVVRGIAVGLARALAAAHGRQVLHCDIKPANVILTTEGEVKLLDFGLARLLDRWKDEQVGVSAPPPDSASAKGEPDLLATPIYVEPSVPPPQIPPTSTAQQPAETPLASETDSQSLLRLPRGTPLYTAPELWDGAPASPKSDVYSVGAVLFSLLTGRPPYQAEDLESLAAIIAVQDVSPVRSVRENIDPGLAQLVDRCLLRNPDSRYSSGTELLAALSSLEHEQSAPSKFRSVHRNRHLLLGGVAVASVLSLGLLVSKRPHPSQAMASLRGGQIELGSSTDEIESAQIWCKQLLGADCDTEVLAQFDRESPRHPVTLRPFRMDRTETTNAAFVAWLNEQPDLVVQKDRYVYQGTVLLADLYPWYQPTSGIVYQPKSHHYIVPSGMELHPVTQVTWDAADRFCRSRQKRLPSEAEWEFAARGEERRRFPWGFEEPRCGDVHVAEAAGQRCSMGKQGPSGVATAKQDMTPDGIYDLAGNVPEWVADAYSERYPPCVAPCLDPKNVPTEPRRVQRVLRGGGWNWSLHTTRAATRSRWWQDEAVTNFGFRCAASLP